MNLFLQRVHRFDEFLEHYILFEKSQLTFLIIQFDEKTF